MKKWITSDGTEIELSDEDYAKVSVLAEGMFADVWDAGIAAVDRRRQEPTEKGKP